MFKDQCISVTTLRTKTKACLQDLAREPKFVFVNNEPLAVLLDIQAYEDSFLKSTLQELSRQEVDSALRRAASSAKKSRKKDLIDI